MSSAPLSPQAQALLSQLEPIVSPPPVGWWPLAPGWWILIILGVCALAAASAWAYKMHQARAYRRQAIALLDQLAPEVSSAYVKNVTAILKRTALSAYPGLAAHINTCYGSRWLAFLNHATPKASFSGGPAKALNNGAYTLLPPNFDPKELSLQAQAWVKKHPSKYPALKLQLLDAAESAGSEPVKSVPLGDQEVQASLENKPPEGAPTDPKKEDEGAPNV